LRAARSIGLNRLLARVIELVSRNLEDANPTEREAALENLAELRTIAAELAGGRGGLRDFLSRFVLASVEEQLVEGVHLMTLHAAKGLEFPVVFLPGLEEGLLPHRRALSSEAELEEERRLCYVGMTRAKVALFLSYAHGRILSGQVQVGHASRFVSEMGVNNITMRISPAAATRPRLPSVAVGERVRHLRWLEGTVEVVEGVGRDTMVTIRFDNGARQRVQLCHAPLVRVSEESSHVLAG
jgi:DNA helicase-2/ATP-dependent DNA helicase PcrA